AAGANQTWAAVAEPAASKATNRGSDFKLSLLGWLLPGTAGVLRSGWPTQKACRLLHARGAAPCPNQCVYRGDGDLWGRTPTGRHLRRCAEHRAPNRLETSACAGSVALRVGGAGPVRKRAEGQAPPWPQA